MIAVENKQQIVCKLNEISILLNKYTMLNSAARIDELLETMLQLPISAFEPLKEHEHDARREEQSRPYKET